MLSFGNLLLWSSQILYLLALLPQIVTNFLERSTRGFSSMTIFIIYIGYLIHLEYVFMLHLPISMRAMTCFGAFLGGILVFQKLYFCPSVTKVRRYMIIYAVTTAVMAVLFLYGLRTPLIAGNIAGWLSTLVWGTFQLPQVVKVFQEKSVQGFSLSFVVVEGAGALSEFIGSVLLALPLQTIINGFRGVIFTVIFLYQFVKYTRK